MTFAELVIKFSTTGDGQTKSQIKAIEVELKNVSNASVIAANKVSQSFQKIGQSSSSIQSLQAFGSNLSNQFIQANASALPFGNTILDLVQSFAILRASADKVSRPVKYLFDNITNAAFNAAQAVQNLLFGSIDKLIEKMVSKTGGVGGWLDPEKFTIFDRAVIFTIEKLDGAYGVLNKFGEKLISLITPSRYGASELTLFANKIQNFINKTGDAIIAVGKFIGVLLTGIAAMSLYSAAVINMDISIAKETIKAAFAFETLQQRLSALTTPEKATEILDFVRRLAEPSNFTTEQLANSAVQLEAFGLQSRRILPIIAQLGMAFGADSEKLRTLTDMFGRLSQGQMPDVQVMAGFGISKSKLMKEGIKFDAQGSLLSSTREVFAALEKIVERDYKKIFETMKNTGDAKLASLVDVFERLKIKIGDALAPLAKTVIDALSKVLSALEGTKILEEMSRILTLPFRAMEKAITGGFSTNIEGALVNFVSGIIAGFEEVNIQVALFIEQMARVGRIVNLVVTGKNTEWRQTGLIGQYVNTPAMDKEMSDFAKNIAGFFAAGRPDKLFGTGFAGEGSRFTKRQQEIADRMKVQLGEPGSNFGDLLKESKLFDYGKLENPLKKESAKQTRQLELIQQNTKTQNELTLRNMTYGGGELAAQGISAVQMGGFRSVSSPQINATNDIVRGVEKIVRGYSNSNNLNFSFRRS
jgi:hypothetical protein